MLENLYTTLYLPFIATRQRVDSYAPRGSRKRADAPHVSALYSRHHKPATHGLYRTFMTLKNPSILFRAMVIAAQGVFYNAFCARCLPTRTLRITNANSQSCPTLSPPVRAIASSDTSKKRQSLPSKLKHSALPSTYSPLPQYPLHPRDRGRPPPQMVRSSSPSEHPSPGTHFPLLPAGLTSPHPRSRRTTGGSARTQSSSTSSTPCAATRARTAS